MAGWYVIIAVIGLAVGILINYMISWLPLEKEKRSGLFRTGFSRWFLVVELLTPAIYLALFAKYGLSMDFVAFAYLMTLLLTAFFVDVDHRIIPDEVVLAGLAGGVAAFACNFFLPLRIYGGGTWWDPLLGILAGSGSLLLIALVAMLIYKSDDALGMGDVKLFAPIGLFLGWKIGILALFLSIFLSGVVSLLLLVAGIKKRKDAIPLGPFIVTAVFICILWGWEILKWYTGS